MLFNLVESFFERIPGIWYHATPAEIVGDFEPRTQGIHLANTIQGALEVMNNRRLNKGYLYSCKITSTVAILYVDFDPMDWTADTIATLLLNKVYSRDSEGSFGDNDEYGDNYRYDISPELIHIDNITETDVPEIEKFLGKRDSNSFTGISKFLESKGYTAIMYPLAEDRSSQTRALILWDPD